MKRNAAEEDRPLAKKKKSLVVPSFLLSSGLATDALERLVAWMKLNKLCIASTRGFTYAGHAEKDHLARPVLAVGRGGFEENIYCDGCVDHCQCCGQACDQDYDPPVGSPHTSVCHHCMEGAGPRCEHAFPETCPCCGRGCRELFEHESRKGVHKECCADCEDKDCDHTLLQ